MDTRDETLKLSPRWHPWHRWTQWSESMIVEYERDAFVAMKDSYAAGNYFTWTLTGDGSPAPTKYQYREQFRHCVGCGAEQMRRV